MNAVLGASKNHSRRNKPGKMLPPSGGEVFGPCRTQISSSFQQMRTNQVVGGREKQGGREGGWRKPSSINCMALPRAQDGAGTIMFASGLSRRQNLQAGGRVRIWHLSWAMLFFKRK